MTELGKKLHLLTSEILRYETIIISRHKWPDGDAYGSSHGLAAILRKIFDYKRILIINEDQSSIGELFNKEDEQISDEEYKNALCIVLDTPIADRVSNSKFNLAASIIKIDHHPASRDEWASISWIDTDYAATSEMIVTLATVLPFVDIRDNKEAARALFTGIVTDTNRFRFSNTTANTLNAAAICLEAGIDIYEIYNFLYLETVDKAKVRGEALKVFNTTKNGVAYLIVDKYWQKRANITEEQAGNLVDEISQLKDCPIWACFVELEDGSYSCRLRSRNLPIVDVAIKHNGGGHSVASGCKAATFEECNLILKELDELIANYNYKIEDKNNE